MTDWNRKQVLLIYPWALGWSWMRHFPWFVSSVVRYCISPHLLAASVWHLRFLLWFLISRKWKEAALHSFTRVEQRSAGGWPLDKPAAVDYQCNFLNHQSTSAFFACYWEMIGNTGVFASPLATCTGPSLLRFCWMEVQSCPEFAERAESRCEVRAVLVLAGSDVGRLR